MVKTSPIKIVAQLKALRIKANLTQRELANAIQTNIKNISAYETDYATPPIEMLVRLADFFNVSLDFLVKGQDFSKSKKTPISND